MKAERNIDFSDIILRQLKTTEELKDQLDLIVEFSYDGIYITDGEANTIKINESYERITGLKRANMMNRNTRDLVEEGYISQSGSQLVLEKRKTVTITQEFKSGKKALITSNPIFDDNNNIIMIVTNVRDVTELYRLKSELEVKEKLAQKYYWENKELKNNLLDTKDFIVRDKRMMDIIQTCKRVAITEITVLIQGESGVGKEEIAKFIHNNSNRKEKQFIKVHCGAIPENLIESELFGYEKGAFTGANKEGKIGLFELADGGTLFLDEIGELPLNMQVKLLRVLQEGEVKRIGSVNTTKIDVRIISATNRNLEEMVQKNEFRQDLYYRLNVIPILILPLRERKDDILELAIHFLKQVNQKYKGNKIFDSNVIDIFQHYSWYGNVRELKNIIERVFAISVNDIITEQDLSRKMLVNKNETTFNIDYEIIPIKEAVAKVEKRLIDNSFKRYGNVRKAAAALKIDPSTFVRKRMKYNK